MPANRIRGKLPIAAPTGPGSIPLCPHQACAFRCCDFKQAGWILLYPGEANEAAVRGLSTKHLEVADPNYHGGHRVRCRARDTAACDGGYKPLDCASYPLFPKPTSDTSPITLTKGAGCPILGTEIPQHQAYVLGLWQRLIKRKPDVLTWLRSVWNDGDIPGDPEDYVAL